MGSFLPAFYGHADLAHLEDPIKMHVFVTLKKY